MDQLSSRLLRRDDTSNREEGKTARNMFSVLQEEIYEKGDIILVLGCEAGLLPGISQKTKMLKLM
jgi:hypothetical protein